MSVCQASLWHYAKNFYMSLTASLSLPCSKPWGFSVQSTPASARVSMSDLHLPGKILLKNLLIISWCLIQLYTLFKTISKARVKCLCLFSIIYQWNDLSKVMSLFDQEDKKTSFSYGMSDSAPLPICVKTVPYVNLCESKHSKCSIIMNADLLFRKLDIKWSNKSVEIMPCFEYKFCTQEIVYWTNATLEECV